MFYFRFLTYNPKKRIRAADALAHEWFRQDPQPVDAALFPTWPAKSEGGRHPPRNAQSPKAPAGGYQYDKQLVCVE